MLQIPIKHTLFQIIINHQSNQSKNETVNRNHSHATSLDRKISSPKQQD